MKSYFSIFLLLLSLTLSAQQNKKVLLKWNIRPGETISYKTVMEEGDSSIFNGEPAGAYQWLKLIKDTAIIRKLKKHESFSNLSGDYDMITSLTKNKKGIIDIETIMTNNNGLAAAPRDTAKAAKSKRSLEGRVALRGALNSDGSVQSFYYDNNLRNVITLLFSLPPSEVKVGDSWPLDVHFISMDPNFRCDSSFNQSTVTFAGWKHYEVGETVAILRYDVVQYASGDMGKPVEGGDKMYMKFTHTAEAEFSVDKGRWISYNGFMITETNAILKDALTSFRVVSLTED